MEKRLLDGQISKKGRTKKNLVGQIFGRLTVVKRSDKKTKHREVYWDCLCECGEIRTVRANSLYLGKQISCGCSKLGLLVGERNGRWKGGKNKHAAGYIYVTPEPNVYILEHRYVMEQHLGRKLVKGETVHHKNGIRDDNRLDNLELWSTSQPKGQRIKDKIAYAEEILRMYKPVTGIW